MLGRDVAGNLHVLPLGCLRRFWREYCRDCPTRKGGVHRDREVVALGARSTMGVNVGKFLWV